jgi:cysteine desulfurase family protein (TIGR01976 family)
MTDPKALGAGLASVRAQFPALSRQHDDRAYSYLDGPGGTQVPRRTIEGMARYLERSNANHEGAFATSEESDAIAAEAHAAAADFLGAGPDEVVFGQNMTTLTFAVSRAIGRTLRAGDEVVVTRLDHDANVAPWLALQEERGVIVRWVGIRDGDSSLDLGDLERALGPRTRVVAVGLASNAVGTISPIPRIVEMAHAVGAWIYVDAVHAAPHMPIDVAALDADFVVCSTYKFFGPHLGLLYGKRERLEQLAAYKVRPAPDGPPGKWETGTPPGESLAGLLGTFEYLAWLGLEFGGAGDAGSCRGARADAARNRGSGSHRRTRADIRLHAGRVDPATGGRRDGQAGNRGLGRRLLCIRTDSGSRSGGVGRDGSGWFRPLQRARGDRAIGPGPTGARRTDRGAAADSVVREGA